MINTELVEKIKAKITTAGNVLVLCHRRPDGDALGSLCAWGRFLSAQKKDYTLFCADVPSVNFSFLPFTLPLLTGNVDLEKFDLIITLDCADLAQTGISETLTSEIALKKVVNIDHHFTNTRFGQINLVESQTSSTCELSYLLMVELGFVGFDKDLSTALLVGILTDTANFTNPATTFTAMKTAAELMSYGARLQQIQYYLEKNKSIAVLKLWGKVLLRLEKNKTSGIAVTVITLADIAEANVDKEAIEGVANFLNSLSQTKAVLVLKEEEGGTVKGSLRTTADDIDVAKIAKEFGGGGHRQSAGFTLRGHLEETAIGWRVV